MSVNLKIIPSLRAGKNIDGHFVLPKKFLDGLAEFRRFWTGDMAVFMAQGHTASGNLDDVIVAPSDLPCEINILPYDEFGAALTTDSATVALLSLDDYRQSELWSTCRERGIPCVYVSEYSLNTRTQIVDATTKNPLRRLRRRSWEAQQERKRKRAVLGAIGLQCNGTPTFNTYRELRSDALLYFDTRMSLGMMATVDEVDQRVSEVGEPYSAFRPLRLVFSGRLTHMKGVMDLIHVAKLLRLLHMDFQLSICGDGELKNKLARAIQEAALTKFVTLKGVLDFATELVPFVKNSADVFLCCHPQGDPSCTYLETMGCGVPIIGYANEALKGVVELSGTGWLTTLNKPDELAISIMKIRAQPEFLRGMSQKALAFARQHTFEQTFKRRVNHLEGLIPERSKAAQTG